MDSFETIESYIKNLKPEKPKTAMIEKIVRVMDLTSLNDTDTESSVALFCQKAHSTYGHVAAVCVWPQFVRLVADQFAGSDIRAVTVANFPHGDTNLETVLIEIGRALENGAQEIDIVFPYQRYLAGDKEYAQSFVAACKAACGDVLLKIILEVSALPDLKTVTEVSRDALINGADFIKTATGKSGHGATLEATAAMLLVTRELKEKLKRTIGVKVAGGVKDLSQAAQYIELADKIMGQNWVTAKTFRIGTSKLMDEIIKMTSSSTV